MAIISIFGGTYCGQDDVAAGIVGELGYRLIDDELAREVSRRYGVDRDRFERSLSGRSTLLNRFTHEQEKHVAYVRMVLAELVQSDDVVLCGCHGHLLPRTIAHVLRVLLVANKDYRIRRAVAETGKSEKEVERVILDDDTRIDECTESLLGRKANDRSLHDLVLPMHSRSVEGAVEEICNLARSEPVRTTERGRSAVHDLLLSARVGLALAEEGLSADVHAEHGHVILLINRFVVRLSRHRERLVEVASRVEGVADVTTRLGQRFGLASVRPWSNIEANPRVMLVDDEKEFVHTLSERLRTRHLDASVAYDGEQALRMLADEEKDVVVLDLMMPGIDGIETLRRIKRDHPNAEVIILTGHGSDREKREAEELGAYAYLRKPVNVDVLARVMREAHARALRSTGGGTDAPDLLQSEDA
jgi:CheY-like chemotaxis protein